MCGTLTIEKSTGKKRSMPNAQEQLSPTKNVTHDLENHVIFSTLVVCTILQKNMHCTHQKTIMKGGKTICFAIDCGGRDNSIGGSFSIRGHLIFRFSLTHLLKLDACNLQAHNLR